MPGKLAQDLSESILQHLDSRAVDSEGQLTSYASPTVQQEALALALVTIKRRGAIIIDDRIAAWRRQRALAGPVGSGKKREAMDAALAEQKKSSRRSK